MKSSLTSIMNLKFPVNDTETFRIQNHGAFKFLPEIENGGKSSNMQRNVDLGYELHKTIENVIGTVETHSICSTIFHS